MSGLIYLLGAGRSGTTILSLLLGNNEGIYALGESHKLPEYFSKEKKCSCGDYLDKCDFWSYFFDELKTEFSSDEYKLQARELESHRYIYKYFINKDRVTSKKTYSHANKKLLSILYHDCRAVVDSAKYIGRALAINSLLGQDVRFIYLVRDPRGVVNSFEKNVQASRNWFSATIYYLLVNSAAELVINTLLRGKVTKLRYEDLIMEPVATLKNLSEELKLNLHASVRCILHNKPLNTGHIIGGNRLVKRKEVLFRSSDNWRDNMPLLKRLTIWILLLPLNLVNNYKL